MTAGKWALVAVLFGSFCAAFAQDTGGGGEKNPMIVRQTDQPLRAVDARLFRAIKAGDTSKVEALLAKGADAGAQDRENVSALQLAAFHLSDPAKMMQILLAHGANINYRGLDGGSTLLLVVLRDHPQKTELLKFLLDHGAEVDYPNFRGESPLSLAVRAVSVANVTILLQHGASASSANLDPFQNLEFDQPQNAVDFNASANAPIFEAVMSWNPTIFELLVKAGADPNAQDAKGFSVYDYAIWQREPAAIAALAANGARVNDLSKRGYSPLEFAVSGQGQGIPPEAAIVRALLTAGADPNLKTHDGRTAEDIYHAYMKEFGARLSADDQILKLLQGK